MKKIVILISAIIFIAMMAFSCKSSNKCAAYGESYKYQKENKY